MTAVNVISLNPDAFLEGTIPAMQPMAKAARIGRLLSVVEQSKTHGFHVRFWEGFTDKPSMRAISKAHKQIVQYAKENRLDSVIIMEDDCVLTSPNAFGYFCSQAPAHYDLYLGGIYSGEIKGGRIMNGFSGLTMYAISHRFYDFFLTANEEDHLDRWLGNFAFDKLYYVCEPFVCYQLGGYSDNQRKTVSYTPFYEGREFFESAPPA